MSTPERSGDAKRVEFELRWAGVHEAPLEWVDAIACSLGSPASPRRTPDSVVLTLGRVKQPFVVGTPEQVQRQVQDFEFVEIAALGRFVMSRDRLEELRNLLNATLEQYDAVLAEGDGK